MAGRIIRSFFYIWFISLLTVSPGFGQIPDPLPMSGLFFSGNHILPASPYRTTPGHKLKIKTKLWLTHKRAVELRQNYSVSFRASFWADFSHGNIFKVENAGYTLKFNFNHHPDSADVHLLLALNSEPTPVSFTFKRSDVHDGKWFDILIEVDEANGIVAGKVNGVTKTFRTKPFLWAKESHISFGADGPTHDCAAMILKDLRLSVNGILEHRWLFTEMEGNTAFDEVGDLDALATDHEWLINRHLNPVEKDSFFIASNRPVSLSVDKTGKEIIIRTATGVTVYDLTMRTLRELPSKKVNEFPENPGGSLPWTTPSIEFEDSADQLNYSLFQYPRKDGVLIRIFTIRLPILTRDMHAALLEDSPTRVRQRSEKLFIWAIAGVTFLIIPVFIWVGMKYSGKRRNKPTRSEAKEQPAHVIQELPDTNYITIFGGIKLVDKNGIDHAERLPRLLKEMLAMIVYHSRKRDGKSREGVVLNHLEEVFWSRIKSENLKNNRNVAFTNIRKAIRGFEGLTLTVRDNEVVLDIPDDISNRTEDFIGLLDQIENSGNPPGDEAFALFAGIVSEGIALADLHSEWAENTSNILRSKVISVLEKYMTILFERRELESCIEVARIAFLHDSLHEVALKFLLRSLFALGQHSETEKYYRIFCEKYFDVFKEEFPFELEELLEE